MPRKPAKPPRPAATELDLLRVTWRLGPSTVKDIHAERARDRPDTPYANVLRMLQVMHGKGLLVRDESQRSHVYAAAHAQGALQTNLLDRAHARSSTTSNGRWTAAGEDGVLGEPMDAQGKVMDEESRRMDENRGPMDELGRRMDLASKPMDELGKRMEVLGNQVDVASAKAERETHAIIDDTMAHDLARPMTR